MSLVSTVYAVKFLRMLTTRFEDLEQFKLGIIDNKGQRLAKTLTPEQRQAWGPFDRIVVNIKSLLIKIPGFGSKIGSYAAALWMLKENYPDVYVKLKDDEFLLDMREMMNETRNNNKKLFAGKFYTTEGLYSALEHEVVKSCRLEFIGEAHKSIQGHTILIFVDKAGHEFIGTVDNVVEEAPAVTTTSVSNVASVKRDLSKKIRKKKNKETEVK